MTSNNSSSSANNQSAANRTNAAQGNQSINANSSKKYNPYWDAESVVVLKYLINSFGSNMQPREYISISIYSDYYADTIDCKDFYINDQNFIVFNELEIPCNKEIVVTLVEISPL